MARKLPWLVGGARGSSKTADRERSAKRRRLSRPDADGQNNTRASAPQTQVQDRAERNPSSSPPPSPPKQEYMQGGLDGDDLWVMVEDEFQSTARLFTQHLHHAEYQRLKKLARSQNASKIQSIARPVDQRKFMSVETENKVEAQRLRVKQSERSHNASSHAGSSSSGQEDDDLDENDPFLQNPRLAGLMTQKAGSRKLSAVISTRPNAQAPPPPSRDSPLLNKTVTTDVATSGPHPGGVAITQSTGSTTQAATSAKNGHGHVIVSSSSSDFAKPSAAGVSSRKWNHKRYSLNAVDHPKSAETQLEPPPFQPTKRAKEPTATSSGFSERMAKRRAEAKNKEEASKRKSLLLDEIPTFLV